MNQALYKYADKYRIGISRIVGGGLIIIVLFSGHIGEQRHLVHFLFDFLGFILIGLCTFGRLWAAMYISGYKDDELISVGPYSIVRHPLYFFSFLGTLGIGLSSGNIIVMIVLPVLFLLYYPFVITSEEKKLIGLFGDRYIQYMKKTPRFLPKFSQLIEPETYTIRSKNFRRSFFDVIWFFLFYILLQFIQVLHTTGVIPILIKFPK